MTMILGQKFFQGIIMIADSRTSLISNGKVIPWRDNAQKIYRLSDHLFIGFAGDIEFAANILYFLFQEIDKNPRLKYLSIFYRKAPKILRYAYNILSEEKKEKRPLGFMIGGVDFNRPVRDNKGKVVGISLFENKLFKISFPNFCYKEADFKNPFLIMGSGEPAIIGNEKFFKKLQFDVKPNLPLTFCGSLIDLSLREKLKKLDISSVGGLSQIITIDINGSGFQPYQIKSDMSVQDIDWELTLNKEGTRYIQHNLKTGKEIPLLYPHEILKITDYSTDLFAFNKNC